MPDLEAIAVGCLEAALDLFLGALGFALVWRWWAGGLLAHFRAVSPWRLLTKSELREMRAIRNLYAKSGARTTRHVEVV